MADYMESLQRSRYSSFSGSLSSSESHRLHEEQTGQKQATDNHTKLSTNNKGKDSSNGSDIPSETKYKIPTIGGQRSNNVDQPVKIPGIASEPEWISIAQVSHQPLHTMEPLYSGLMGLASLSVQTYGVYSYITIEHAMTYLKCLIIGVSTSQGFGLEWFHCIALQ